MTTDKRQFTLRIQEEVHNKIKHIAEKNKRSLTMEIEFAIERYIEEYETKYGKIKEPQ